MKNLSLTIGLIICLISITSCTSSSTEIIKETPTNNSQQINSEMTQSQTKNSIVNTSPQATPTTAVSPNPEKLPNSPPTIGTVKELVNGDLLCYATLTDEQGMEHQVGASFEICAESAKFLNKKVRASYTIESVSDCQSAEPCGKSKKESIITKMEVLS
ncbi:hypothetical protein IQ244_24120 [Nostoc sp. LEGE 06077]|uniref:hypothetical protein n=1 Tax=Nostoc sp. LEGE 06077 TaxID=915325 RepID=UPI00188275FE|nr:hypothetical protein [Nostoc sp. LEGE 06077]MBE9209528.1 hypothetical protein [Nostoc sp. LEGE 06077]